MDIFSSTSFTPYFRFGRIISSLGVFVCPFLFPNWWLVYFSMMPLLAGWTPLPLSSLMLSSKLFLHAFIMFGALKLITINVNIGKLFAKHLLRYADSLFGKLGFYLCLDRLYLCFGSFGRELISAVSGKATSTISG